MRRTIERLIIKNGTRVIIHTHGTTYDTKVLLQLVASKSWQNMERMIPTGGEVLRGQFLLICPSAIPIEPADTIVLGKRTFLLRRVEPFRFRDRNIFYWGLCVEGGTLEG